MYLSCAWLDENSCVTKRGESAQGVLDSAMRENEA